MSGECRILLSELRRLQGVDVCFVRLVSKFGSLARDNTMHMPTGLVLLNFRTGDEAEYLIGPDDSTVCPCGRRTPVITNIRRIEDVQSKLRYGCSAQ
jgi:hypothetical protein